MNDLRVRAANPEDGPAAAPLMLASGEALFRYLFYEDAAKTIDLIARLFARETNEFTFESGWVAEQDGAARGVMQLVDRGSLERNEAGTGRAITAEVGLFGMLRRLPRFGRFEKLVVPVDADVLYVKLLAVDAAARGQGIGSRLIELAAEQAREQGLGRVALDVLVDNHGARRLYERHGFIVGQTTTDPKLERACGFTGFVRMERET